MAIIIRDMIPDEAGEVRRLGKKTFEGFESLFVPKPKEAFVAYDGEQLVGAVLYKYLKVGDLKIGYADFVFVDKRAHGKRIGSQLISKCVQHMWSEGCDGQSAIVRADNVGSWQMFLNEGFTRVSLVDMVKSCGWAGMFKQAVTTPLFVATGMEYYLTLKDTQIKSNKDSSPAQMLSYLMLSVLSLLPLFIYGLDYAITIISSVILVLLVRVLFGWIGTWFTKEKWHFRLTEGGILPPMIAALTGGLYIISGNWYPTKYRKGKDFKRALGMTSWFQWLSLVVLSLMFMPLGDDSYFKIIGEIAKLILIFNVIPFYPVSPLGGKRIWEWSKRIYGVTFVLTVLVVFFVG